MGDGGGSGLAVVVGSVMVEPKGLKAESFFVLRKDVPQYPINGVKKNSLNVCLRQF
jgi:hypothetical protein